MQIHATKPCVLLSEAQLTEVIDAVRLISRIESRFEILGTAMDRAHVDIDRTSFDRIRTDLYLFRIGLRSKFSDHLKAIVQQGRELKRKQAGRNAPSHLTFDEPRQAVSLNQTSLTADLRG